jgi:hypothetical protein
MNEHDSLLLPDVLSPLNIVVFDLDETLGYFSKFGMFWAAIETFYGKQLSQDDFNATFELYPEFIRPNITDILTFLKKKKDSKKCSHVMIYTNNQGPKEWAISIKNYFEYKMGFPIFDRIIGAFKVDGKLIEVCRTSHNKKHDDFIKCTKLPSNSQICFLDDMQHPEMVNENVYYINLKPYIYDLPCETLIQRYMAHYPEVNGSKFNRHAMSHMAKYNHEYVEKNLLEYEVEKIITKQIMEHLKLFFAKKPAKPKTRRKKE